jgi:hypothetical protein
MKPAENEVLVHSMVEFATTLEVLAHAPRVSELNDVADRALAGLGERLSDASDRRVVLGAGRFRT